MQIESAKEHIEHVLKLKSRKEQVTAMKDFWVWVASMPESQRRIYLLDLLKAEHFLPENRQKAEIKSVREEAMIDLSDKARMIIEKSFENLHEETHLEKGERLENL